MDESGSHMEKNWYAHPLPVFMDELIREGISLPLSGDLTVLGKPGEIMGKKVLNRIVIQPMEGCDATGNGKPADMTRRRYMRFANSGAGMIWFEATAILREGCANPRQLMLNADTLDDFKRLTDEIRQQTLKAYGYAPLLVLQATHSGRYSNPDGSRRPLIAYRLSAPYSGANADSERILSDDELSALPEQFSSVARLAEQAGFDAVDVKACHRYLLSELLSAHTRAGKYGGPYGNRVRLLLDCVHAAKAGTNQLIITSRLNVYDGYAWPNGWGVSESSGIEPDMEEPVRLLKDLLAAGVPLVNLTLGNPYFNPHVNRPYDGGANQQPEHPLRGVERACRLIGRVKQAVPQMKVVASALSYLRTFAGHAGAGMIQKEYADFAGYGRMAFAYPDFAAALLKDEALNPKKVCVTCGKCTELMRMGSITGCAIRDALYMKRYREAKDI